MAIKYKDFFFHFLTKLKIKNTYICDRTHAYGLILIDCCHISEEYTALDYPSDFYPQQSQVQKTY